MKPLVADRSQRNSPMRKEAQERVNFRRRRKEGEPPVSSQLSLWVYSRAINRVSLWIKANSSRFAIGRAHLVHVLRPSTILRTCRYASLMGAAFWNGGSMLSDSEKALAEMITLRNKIRDEGISCHILSLKNKYIIK